MPKDKYSVAPIDWNRSNVSVKAYYNYTFIVQIKNIMSFKHTHIYIFKMLNKQKKRIYNNVLTTSICMKDKARNFCDLVLLEPTWNGGM